MFQKNKLKHKFSMMSAIVYANSKLLFFGTGRVKLVTGSFVFFCHKIKLPLKQEKECRVEKQGGSQFFGKTK